LKKVFLLYSILEFGGCSSTEQSLVKDDSNSRTQNGALLGQWQVL